MKLNPIKIVIHLFMSLCLSSLTTVSAQGSELNDQLYDVLSKTKYRKAKKLIKQGADVNAIFNDNGKRETLLIRAAAKGNIEQLKFLLEYGADVNKKLSKNNLIAYNDKAITYALKNKHSEAVKILYNAGALIPWEYTVDHIGIEALQTLADVSVDFNAPGYDGRYALEFGNHQSKNINDDSTNTIWKYLVDHGANPNLVCLLCTQTKYNDTIAIKQLIALGADINQTDNKGNNAYYYSKNNSSTRKLLIKQGISFDIKTLSFSFVKQNLDDIQFIHLLNSKGYIFSEKLLLEAIKMKDITLVKLMLDGNESDHLKKESSIVLHTAMRYRKNDNIKILLSYGANPNAVDNNKQTSLHIAAQFNDFEMIKLLIKYGADLNKINKRGETVLSLLSSGKNSNTLRNVKYIINKGGKDPNNKALLNATQKGNIQLIDLLLENGYEINPKIGASPLYETTNLKVFKHLISKGADITRYKSYDQYSILENIIESQNLDLLKYTLSVGADPNVKGEFGTPILFTTRNYEQIALLLQYGAKVDARNTTQPFHNYTTVPDKMLLHIAAKQDNLKLVNLLLSYGASRKSIDYFGKMPHEYAGSKTKKILQF
ncbi:ankyrin repeat domain-containing protein [Aquimarina sp. AU119]|uniref:ankyrin repeat domain-containing protein n=1 Tax=Aquimarina sp. AU119 TaxID=2108528 RepID=UPI000D691EE8|nr:ankyrin repeat domain-containing protein [Aquimarina sp. AU119]